MNLLAWLVFIIYFFLYLASCLESLRYHSYALHLPFYSIPMMSDAITNFYFLDPCLLKSFVNLVVEHLILITLNSLMHFLFYIFQVKISNFTIIIFLNEFLESKYNISFQIFNILYIIIITKILRLLNVSIARTIFWN